MHYVKIHVSVLSDQINQVQPSHQPSMFDHTRVEGVAGAPCHRPFLQIALGCLDPHSRWQKERPVQEGSKAQVAASTAYLLQLSSE